jgi:hypothetical protein
VTPVERYRVHAEIDWMLGVAGGGVNRSAWILARMLHYERLDAEYQYKAPDGSPDSAQGTRD